MGKSHLVWINKPDLVVFQLYAHIKTKRNGNRYHTPTAFTGARENTEYLLH